MKKLLLFIFTLLLPLVASADAYNVKIDGICYNLFDNDKTAEVTSSNPQYSGYVIIPETVTYNDNQYSVTSIGYYAFYGCRELTSINIPNSVTSIGYSAFRYCSGLTSINIPNSVTSIGYGAFGGCSGLTSITIPNSVTSIGYEAFYDCYVTKENFHNQSNTIPSDLTVCDVRTESGICIKGNALVRYLGKETTYSIPNSITNIGERAFLGCTGLTSVTIPNSVTSIGKSAFYGCSGLTSITIPNSVTSIGANAFSRCSGPTSITIPNSVTTIGKYTFCECSKLTSVTIPNSVTTIGKSAFRDCYVSKEKVHNQSNMPLSGLTICDVRTVSGICIKDNIFVKYLGKEPTITIPNNITSIGDEAFYHNSELTSINIPNNVTNIGEKAFFCCTGLTSVTIPNSITSIGKEAFCGCSGLTSIIIPNNLTSISKRAYAGCTGLTSINIPNSVTNIEDEAFTGCSGLTSVNFSKNITTIGNSAFRRCSGLTSAIIPNNVTTIGNLAFYKCTGLTSVIISDNVTFIGNSAFHGCTELTSINIPSNIKNILDLVFAGCKKLKTVYCYATKLPETRESAFGNYDNNQHLYINYATLYVPASAIKEYKATAPWSWFGTILPIEDATTQIDAASTNDYNIVANGSNIIVKSDADGEKVSIYTINGQLIGATAIRNGSAVINTNLKSGSVAIVMIGQNTYKIRFQQR